MQDLIRGIGPFNLEFRVRNGRDGQERWVSGQGSLEFDSQGQTTRLIGTMLDITERKLAEAEIHHLNQTLEQRVKDRTAQLEAANRELEAFSYSVSHDLRAPLRSIDGYSAVLLEDYAGGLEEGGRTCLQRVRSATRRMGQLIEDLLKLSSVSRSELEWTELELADLCREILDELTQANPDQRVDFSIQAGLRIRADRRFMRVVLENLLRNAVKFTTRRQDPRIEVGAAPLPGGGRAFHVKDNGVGFDMALAGKLFDPFQRLHSAADFEGTGIGLAIVQRIIHRHGGRIWAEAEVGKGATFFFTLAEPEGKRVS